MRFAIVLIIAFVFASLKTRKGRKIKAEQDLINFWNDLGSSIRAAASKPVLISQFRMVK
jgi:hypothetical protein